MSKVADSFHVDTLRHIENKKCLLELILVFFKQNISYCLAKIKSDTAILPFDAGVVKIENSSFTLMPSLISSQK